MIGKCELTARKRERSTGEAAVMSSEGEGGNRDRDRSTVRSLSPCDHGPGPAINLSVRMWQLSFLWRYQNGPPRRGHVSWHRQGAPNLLLMGKRESGQSVSNLV